MTRVLDRKAHDTKSLRSEDVMKPKDYDALYEPLRNRLMVRFGIDGKEAGRFARKYIQERKASQKVALVLDQLMKDGAL